MSKYLKIKGGKTWSYWIIFLLIFTAGREVWNLGSVHLSSIKLSDKFFMQVSVRVEPCSITCSPFSTLGNISSSSVWTIWLIKMENSSPSNVNLFETENIFTSWSFAHVQSQKAFEHLAHFYGITRLITSCELEISSRFCYVSCHFFTSCYFKLLINSCGLSWLTWFIIQLYPWRLAENGWLWFDIPLKDSVEEYNFLWFDVWHCRKEKPRCFMQSSSFTVTKQVVWSI